MPLEDFTITVFCWVELHQHLLIDLGAATDPIRLVDGYPLPVCVLTRAP
ncbi:MAG: hypothetical protein KDJ22_02060 [Candidatus Competibacteraceae bacterium]|nr:hypothetical protein [Candidatus Competibacteraceae bacterium]MCP5124853.1 hypothetical protein [Gammaproteobacteria bacterium]